MNDTVRIAFEAALAATERSNVTPVAALAYGRDLACVMDCTDGFEETDPESPAGIAQAQARRFQTPRGGLGADDLNYGFDLLGLLHVGLTQSDLLTLQNQLVGEARKDERVDQVAIRLAYTNNALRVSSFITPRNARTELFQFVLNVTSADVLIELHR